jgi:hypothetical protein
MEYVALYLAIGCPMGYRQEAALPGQFMKASEIAYDTASLYGIIGIGEND